MLKALCWAIEDLIWNFSCQYNLWLHGPYGLAKVIEKMPFRFIIKYLRKYGATIGEHCRFERGLNIHRPFGKKPFENLLIGNNVYLGHNTLLDLSKQVIIDDNVIIASRVQIWTHASLYKDSLGKTAPEYLEKNGEVNICRNSIIYSNTLIAHSVIIGENTRIAAGSVVNRSIPDYGFFGGVPAKEIRKKQEQ